eukprot:7255440-Alexandrium_andersonii.AAC.1
MLPALGAVVTSVVRSAVPGSASRQEPRSQSAPAPLPELAPPSVSRPASAVGAAPGSATASAASAALAVMPCWCIQALAPPAPEESELASPPAVVL